MLNGNGDEQQKHCMYESIFTLFSLYFSCSTVQVKLIFVICMHLYRTEVSRYAFPRHSLYQMHFRFCYVSLHFFPRIYVLIFGNQICKTDGRVESGRADQPTQRSGPVFTFSSSIHFAYIRVSSIKCRKKLSNRASEDGWCENECILAGVLVENITNQCVEA